MKNIVIKGKPYIEVNERLKEFRTNPKYEGYTLETELISLTDGICTMKAVIRNGNNVIVATGFAQEKESSSFINKTSFVENTETSAWGRALGNLGIGIDTSIASAEEVLNAMANQKDVQKNVKSATKDVQKNAELDDSELDRIAEEEAKQYVCSECGCGINKNIHGYSMVHWGVPYCTNCQKKHKAERKD